MVSYPMGLGTWKKDKVSDYRQNFLVQISSLNIRKLRFVPQDTYTEQ